MAYYRGKNEYRWSYITTNQGHYPLHKNLANALKFAYTKANKRDEPVLVQGWKPRGKNIYIVRPKLMKWASKQTLISWYKDQGYNIDYISPKKYVLK